MIFIRNDKISIDTNTDYNIPDSTADSDGTTGELLRKPVYILDAGSMEKRDSKWKGIARW
jgi:hypothetical protein